MRDGLDGQFVVEELGAEMLFGGMFQQPGGVVPVEGGESLFGMNVTCAPASGAHSPEGR